MSTPEPLTPFDCDLRGLPFMPMDVVRLLDSDIYALSTGDEFKAAFSLWMKSWFQVPAASVPDDDRVLAHLSGAGSRWKRLKPMALKGWVKCSDGRLYHPVVAEKAAEAWKHRQAQRDRANKRWGNTGNGSSGNATAHTSAYATAHATASPTAMQGTGTVKKESISPPSVSRARELPEARLPADLQAVMEAGGYVSPPGDTDKLRIWYALGADLEQDILPTIRRVKETLSKAPFTLKVFDAPIREKLATDQREIEHLRRVAARNAPEDQRTAAGGIG